MAVLNSRFGTADRIALCGRSANMETASLSPLMALTRVTSALSEPLKNILPLPV